MKIKSGKKPISGKGSMKAITLWQPWASLIAVEAKKYETRSWFPRYCGPLAIHAASKSIREILRMLDYWTMQTMANALGLDSPEDLSQLPTGCVVATCRLAGCYEIVRLPHTTDPVILRMRPYQDSKITVIDEPERTFGDFTPGRYAWELDAVRALPEPVNAKGLQGLWDWRMNEVNCGKHRDEMKEKAV